MVRTNNSKIRSLIDSNEFDEATKLLEENLKADLSDSGSYQLLVDIYRKEKNFQKAIKVLNQAIKFSGDKTKFRDLKKKMVVDKIIEDIEDLDQ